MNKETLKTVAAGTVLVIATANAVAGLVDAYRLVRKENQIKKNANKEES